MDGRVISFSASDLAATAAAYDPAVHEAPYVIGHPQTDGPAWGWVQGLAVAANGCLVATPRQVAPAFAELVAAGRFKKRSASFYPPGHAGNPMPGVWYLKHVGWLGATPPALKGLADAGALASYGEAEPGLVCFGDWDDELNASLWRRMREWLIGKFGQDEADAVLPSGDLDALQREALRDEQPDEDDVSMPPPTTAFAEGAPAVTQATPEALQQAARLLELDAREARVAAAELAQAALVRSARTAAVVAFCAARLADGRLLPPERDSIVALAAALPDTIEVIEFADGDIDKPVKRSPLEVLQAFIAGLPPRVDFAERARAEATPAVDAGNALSLAAAAQAYQFAEHAAGREVAFDAAVEHVARAAAAQAA